MDRTLPKIRVDLRYHEEEKDGRVVVFVQDPLRGNFYGLNELQIEAMRLLDGKRTNDELAQLLSDKYETEIPIEKVEKLVAFLEGKLLLDVCCYHDAKRETARAVRRVVRKRGLIPRRSARVPDTMEASLFDRGLACIDNYQPVHAARYFTAVVEINPNHQRARLLLAAIHEAFFRSQREMPSYMRMIHVWNPERLLRWLSAKMGRIVFSFWFVLGMILLFGATLPVVADLSAPKQLHGSDALLFYLLVYWPAVALHELAHAFACTYFGGKVDDIGVAVFFGGLPGAYSDVTDVHTFRDKRRKVIVYLAGPAMDLIFVCVVLQIYYHGGEHMFLHAAIPLLLVFAFGVIHNTTPLILGTDGYYAFANWVEMPNLASDSYQFVSELLKYKILGIAPQHKWTTREKRILGIYGVVGTGYFLLYLYGIWFRFLMPLAVKYLHGVGLLIVVLHILSLLKKRFGGVVVDILRFLWTHRGELFRSRRIAYFSLAALMALVAFGIPWPMLIDGDLVLRPAARAVVASRVDGLVARIDVKEGDRVRADQIIAVLRNDALADESQQCEQDLIVARLRRDVLVRGATREELAVAQTEARSGRLEQDSAREAAVRAHSLARVSVTTRDEMLAPDTKLRQAAAQTVQAQLRLDELHAGSRREDVAHADAVVRGLEERLAELGKRLNALVLKSPIDGVVVGTRVEEHTNHWLRAGTPLCEVHDLSQVYAEIRLPMHEALANLSAGHEHVLLSFDGDPNRRVRTRVAVILPGSSTEGEILARTEPLVNRGWPSGFVGHARVYGRRRSMLYQLVGVPVLQMIDYKVWQFWG